MGERARDREIEPARDLGPQLRGVPLELALHHLREQLALGLVGVWPLVREHLEHDDAEREQIGARVDGGGVRVLLGADVERRAEQLVAVRQLELVVGLCEAEVEDLHGLEAAVEARRQVDVRALEIAVDHTPRVERLERTEHADRDARDT